MEGLEEGILDTVPWDKVMMLLSHILSDNFFVAFFAAKDLNKNSKAGEHWGGSSGVHPLKQDQHFEDNGCCRL